MNPPIEIRWPPIRGPANFGSGVWRQRQTLRSTQSLLACASIVCMVALGSHNQGSRPRDLTLASSIPASLGQGEFYELSCSSSTFCLGIGESGGQGDGAAFSATWNGRVWRRASGRFPVSGSTPGYDLMGGVSCDSSKFCMAVASQCCFTWNGQRWSRLELPLTRLRNVGAASVDCLSSSDCWISAEADRRRGSSSAQPVVLRWRDGNWTIWSGRKLGPDLGSTLAGTGSISCSSGQSCLIAGSGGRAGGHAGGLVWNGRIWSSPRLSKAALQPRAVYRGASCSAASSCLAIGTIGTGNGVGDRWLADWMNGTKFTPAPSLSGKLGDLNSVSCRADDCDLIGLDATSNEIAVVATAHKAQRFAVPPGMSETGALNAIACFQPGRCMAVGERTSADIDYAAAYLLDRKRWSTTRSG